MNIQQWICFRAWFVLVLTQGSEIFRLRHHLREYFDYQPVVNQSHSNPLPPARVKGHFHNPSVAWLVPREHFVYLNGISLWLFGYAHQLVPGWSHHSCIHRLSPGFLWEHWLSQLSSWHQNRRVLVHPVTTCPDLHRSILLEPGKYFINCLEGFFNQLIQCHLFHIRSDLLFCWRGIGRIIWVKKNKLFLTIIQCYKINCHPIQ